MIAVLIDDDPFTNEYHSILLKDIYPEISVYSYENALNVISDIKSSLLPKANLILTDKNMPFMNGWEFISKLEKLIQSQTWNPTVCLISDHLDSEDYKRIQTLKRPIHMSLKSQEAPYLNLIK